MLYRLNLIERTMNVFDEDGIELSDANAARAMAIEAARDIMSSQVKSGVLDLSARIDITDETGAVVDSLSFAEALRIIPVPASN